MKTALFALRDLMLFLALLNRQIFSCEEQSKHDWRLQSVWTEGRLPYEDRVIQIAYCMQSANFSFQGNLKASGSNIYPQFQNETVFFRSINKRLLDNAKSVLCKFISEVSQTEEIEEPFDQEARDIDFDKRELSYQLTPVYASDRIVSIFGVCNEYRGLPHGSSCYYGFNYWNDGQECRQLTLEDLFSQETDFENFLIAFCLNTLKKDKAGYFSSGGAVTVEMKFKHLKAFTLSEKGLTITFQPYHVGGWADGPYCVTIPFENLRHLIMPNGPLNEFLRKS